MTRTKTSSLPSNARPEGKSSAFFVLLIVCSIVAALLLSLGFQSYFADRHFGSRQQWASNLTQVEAALGVYHQVNGTYPPAYLTDAEGRPAHSWRVLILPYLDQDDLYQRYSFNEPWNGPNNRRLANQMPRFFRFPSSTGPHTNIVAIAGSGTAFPPGGSTSIDDMIDGHKNTAILSELTDSDIQWLEPRDFDLDTAGLSVDGHAAKVTARGEWRGRILAFADGRFFSVKEEMPIRLLRSLLTINGGEPTSRDELARAGYIQAEW